MMSTEIPIDPTGDEAQVFKQLDEYPWDTDPQFQAGLSAILGGATEPDQVENLSIRAKCYYLSRKKSIPINFDAYKTYHSSKSTPIAASDMALSTNQLSSSASSEAAAVPDQGLEDTAAAPSNDPQAAPYPQTFKEIVEMIKAGVTLPGCVDIEPTLLTLQATQPVQKKRRKPWEADVPEEAVQGAGSLLPVIGGNEGEVKVIEGTFGDQRDRHIIQEFPEDA